MRVNQGVPPRRPAETLGHRGRLDKGYSRQVTNVIAHRGASGDEQANTIAAFRAAGLSGADAVELDVRMTVEGEVVVAHDAALHDGRLISATARADLPSFIPDLHTALIACAGMWVNVELKADDTGPADAFVDAVLSSVTGRPAGQRLLFSSFSPSLIETCRNRLVGGTDVPSMRSALLCGPADGAARQQCIAIGHEAIHPNVALLTRDDLDRCHELGLEVNVWTCNDVARMRELIEWGIDGICTDVPAALVDVLSGQPT